jgi:hypothetical protein
VANQSVGKLQINQLVSGKSIRKSISWEAANQSENQSVGELQINQLVSCKSISW